MFSVLSFDLHRKHGILHTVSSMLSNPTAVGTWISLYGFLVLKSVFQSGQSHLPPVFSKYDLQMEIVHLVHSGIGRYIYLVLSLLALVYYNEGALLTHMEGGFSQSTCTLFTLWKDLAPASRFHLLLGGALCEPYEAQL